MLKKYGGNSLKYLNPYYLLTTALTTFLMLSYIVNSLLISNPKAIGNIALYTQPGNRKKRVVTQRHGYNKSVELQYISNTALNIKLSNSNKRVFSQKTRRRRYDSSIDPRYQRPFVDAYNHQWEDVKSFIEQNGINVVFVRNWRQRSIVFYIVDSGNLEMLKWLVEKLQPGHHSLYNLFIRKDREGRNVLFYAAMSGNLEMLKWLVEEIENGSNDQDYGYLNKGDRIGYTILLYAISSCNLEMVKWLVEEKNLDLKEEAYQDGSVTYSFIYEVIYTNVNFSDNQKIIMAKWLIEKWADTYGMRDALFQVIEVGSVELLEFIVNKDARQGGSVTYSVIYEVIYTNVNFSDNQKIIMAKWLIEKWADTYGMHDALFQVVEVGSVELLEFIVNKDARQYAHYISPASHLVICYSLLLKKINGMWSNG